MNIDKVLVVDDSKVAHLTLRKMLTERGIDVDWVGSGEDSIDYLKGQKPDLIFMDVMMPGMDGYETAEVINKDDGLEQAPLIMCSANTTDEDKENAEKLGAIDFLSKPYTADELDSILNKVRALEDAQVDDFAQADVFDQVVAEAEQAASTEVAEPLSLDNFNDLPSLDDQLQPVASEQSEPAEPELTVNDLEISPAELPAQEPVFDTPPLAAVSAARISDDDIQRIEQIAERIAREIASETARPVAQEAAQEAAETASRKAAQAATQAAKALAERTVQSAVGDITRTVAQQVSIKLNSAITQQIADQSAQGPDLEKMRDELQQRLHESLQVALGGEGVKKQLQQLVKLHALPKVESTARNTAASIADEYTRNIAATDRSPAALKTAKVALFFSLLALLGVVGFFLWNETSVFDALKQTL